MSGRATLIHAAFRKSEEIDDEKGEKGEFAVNSFPLVLIMMGSDVGRPATRRPDASRSPKRHPNLVQGKRRNRALRGIVHQVCAQWAFGGSDVVLHPHQSLDPSSRGTTSPGSDGHSVEPTWCFTPAKALIFRRGAPRRPRPAGHRLVRRGASPPPKP